MQSIDKDEQDSTHRSDDGSQVVGHCVGVKINVSLTSACVGIKVSNRAS